MYYEMGTGVGRAVSYSIPGVSRVGDLWVLEQGELYPTVPYTWSIQNRGRVGAVVGRFVSYSTPEVSRVEDLWVLE